MKIQAVKYYLTALYIVLCGHALATPIDTLNYIHEMRITDQIGSPLRVAIDKYDNVYVTDSFYEKIIKFNSAGEFQGKFSSGVSPLAIAIDSKDHLYTSDRKNGTIRVVDTSGVLLSSAFHGFIFPSDGIVDDQDNFYVVDSKAKKVRVFNANRDELFSFGEDMLFYPTAIAFDKKNQRLLVAEHGGLDFRNIRLLVHIFTKQGIWQSSIAQFGWLEGEIARIQGLAVDNAGRIYIADTFLGIVTVLDENGRYITTIGDYGTESGEMRSPMDIAIDSQNRLWITSKNNRQLEVFRIEDPHLKNSTSNIEQDISHNLLKFQLLQNFPNPFNPQTEIPFVLENDGYVTISIYSEIGQIVRRFDLGYLSAGNASVLWNATNNLGQKVASGIYLYEIRVNEFVAVRRMLLMR